jgi:peptidyl-prolyl cis-trans isomerase A (cyclophilin A)
MKTLPFFFAILLGFSTVQCQQAPVQKQTLQALTSAPDKFFVLVKTTKGDFTMTVNRQWAPLGVDHFYLLVKSGFYSDIALFRVIDGFMAQFGIHGDPTVQKKWDQKISDDPVVQSNDRGFVSYATAGPGTRTTQLFINYGDNSRLDKMGFSPFARVDEVGMKVVDAIFKTAPKREGSQTLEIDQGKIEAEGNAFLRKKYPKLDYIKSMEIVP